VYIDLNDLILWCQCVDDLDETGLFWKIANTVTVILPPRPAKVVSPIRVWEGRWYVNESSMWCVWNNTASLWIYMCADLLFIQKQKIVYNLWLQYNDRILQMWHLKNGINKIATNAIHTSFVFGLNQCDMSLPPACIIGFIRTSPTETVIKSIKNDLIHRIYF